MRVFVISWMSYWCIVLISLTTLTTEAVELDIDIDNDNDNGTPVPLEYLLDLGDTALMEDDLPTAIKYYEQAVPRIDEDESLITAISIYTNLGTAYDSTSDLPKAVSMYRNAILHHAEYIPTVVSQPTKTQADQLAAQASFFLGMTQESLQNYSKAADAYAYASQLDPNHWSSLANLGAVLHDRLRRPDEALLVYNEAYSILSRPSSSSSSPPPTDPPENPRPVLSQLQYRIGLAITHSPPDRKCALQEDPEREVPCSEMAANAFSRAVELDGGNGGARHMLASVTADGTMGRASDEYVTMLFEDYAESFEHSLVDELGYDGFQRLRRAFDRALGGADEVPRFELVVDAGCGTGLVGEQFRNVSQTLIGADLSPSILQEALKLRPNLYDHTEVGDVTKVFTKLKGEISLIVAADSYIYFGDLVPLFEAMEVGLMEGGYVAFTLENVSEEDEGSLEEMKPDWRWQLTPSGRFAHRREYVETVGGDLGLETIRYEPMDGFRREGAKDVRGHIFVMRKRSRDEL